MHARQVIERAADSIDPANRRALRTSLRIGTIVVRGDHATIPHSAITVRHGQPVADLTGSMRLRPVDGQWKLVDL